MTCIKIFGKLFLNNKQYNEHAKFKYNKKLYLSLQISKKKFVKPFVRLRISHEIGRAHV